MQRRAAIARVDVVHRSDAAPALDLCAQGSGQPVAPPLVFKGEAGGDVRLHDRLVPLPGLAHRLAEVLHADAGSQRLDQFLEGEHRPGLGPFPHRRTHEGQGRSHRRRLLEDAAKRRRRDRVRRGVAGVEPGDYFHAQRDVVEVPGKDADRVERGRQPQDAGTRHQAEAGLETVDTAECRRSDRRTVCLRADRERHHAGRDGRGRAARGAAGRAREVMGVACLAWRQGSEFGRDRRARDERAAATKHRDDRRVPVGTPSGMQHRAVLGGQVDGVDDVLDADRHAVERAEAASAAPFVICPPRLVECMFAIDECPGTHVALARFDLGETGVHQVFRAQLAIPDGLRRLGCTHPLQAVHRLRFLVRLECPRTALYQKNRARPWIADTDAAAG